jgi:hypothetical protein
VGLLAIGLTMGIFLAIPQGAGSSVLYEHDTRSFVGEPLQIALWGRQDGEPTSVLVQVRRNGKLLVERNIDAAPRWTRYTLLQHPKAGGYKIYLHGGDGWDGYVMTIEVVKRRQAHWRNCGNQKGMGAGFYDVHAKNIGCKKAKGVAHKYFWGGGALTGQFWGFSCKSRRIALEVSKVRCARPQGERTQVVKFRAGA